MSKFSNYITDSLAELRQVRWPTRAQSIRLTIIVIIFIIVTSISFGIVDAGLTQIIRSTL